MNKELELAMIRAKACYYAQDRDLVIEFNDPKTTKERKIQLVELNKQLVELYNMVKKELTLYRALVNKENKTNAEKENLIILEDGLCQKYDVGRGLKLRAKSRKLKKIRSTLNK